MAVFLSKSTSFYNGAHLRRVDTLVPDASVQARSWGPGLDPLALNLLYTAHLRRVDTLVPDTRVQASSWGPGLVPLALHGPNIVRLLCHRIHKPSPCSTLVAEKFVRLDILDNLL